MIEILKRGTKEKCTCKECGCIFTYEADDIKSTVHGLYGGNYSYVNCPQCDNEIHLIEVK